MDAAPAPQPDLSVDLGGLRMRNPVTVASGTFGYGREYADYVDLRRLGAITCKGIRLDPVEGNPQPRIDEVRGGMLNAIGLQNPAVDVFLERDLPYLKQFDTRVMVNVCGHFLEE